ncbi:hypothetical protein, partial [Methanocalculus sp.]|uniref:hypothetical protein n=1 Tax=Methanocalculus sp. TaxID=2004547 RepID=UPI002609D586
PCYPHSPPSGEGGQGGLPAGRVSQSTGYTKQTTVACKRYFLRVAPLLANEDNLDFVAID